MSKETKNTQILTNIRKEVSSVKGVFMLLQNYKNRSSRMLLIPEKIVEQGLVSQLTVSLTREDLIAIVNKLEDDGRLVIGLSSLVNEEKLEQRYNNTKQQEAEYVKEKGYDDNTLIHFGKHKGKKLANVPAAWLLWYHAEANKYGTRDKKLIDYIASNMDLLKAEVARTKTQTKINFEEHE